MKPAVRKSRGPKNTGALLFVNATRDSPDIRGESVPNAGPAKRMTRQRQKIINCPARSRDL
jgi:hypothetical protein